VINEIRSSQSNSIFVKEVQEIVENQSLTDSKKLELIKRHLEVLKRMGRV
jgi:hypothetical protein